MSDSAGDAGSEEYVLAGESDMVALRRAVREALVEAGFSLIDQTKMVTATSELARNVLRYADTGRAELSRLVDGGRLGIRLTVSDDGPGIEDVDRALRDGFTTGGGLGLGLGGAKRLTDGFEIRSSPGEGVRVTIIKWKRT